MIIRALFIPLPLLVHFPLLQLPPKVMAQASSEGAKVLVDDVIQALKNNDTSKAQIYLNILNQQLTANSSITAV